MSDWAENVLKAIQRREQMAMAALRQKRPRGRPRKAVLEVGKSVEGLQVLASAMGISAPTGWRFPVKKKAR